MSTPERSPEPRAQAPLWFAAGAAVFGVLLGGAAVFLGLEGRPPPVAAAPTSADGGCCDLTRSDRPSPRVDGSAPTLADAVASTRDSVVTLRGAGGLLGAGVIVDPSGLVLTNFHVVAPQLRGGHNLGDDQAALVVRFANGRELPGTLLIGDREQDIAVLRLQPADTAESFRAVRLGRSADLEVGESVFVVGTPLGLEHSVSSGIVAALDRSHILANHRLSLIQIDASINFGSSGGPLFNLEGELVGITTAMAERAQGIGFAIPSDHIRALLRAFVEGGVRRSGQVGIEADAERDLSPAAYALGYRNGVVVTEVIPGLPAEAAGIRPGDELVEVRGRRYDAFGEGKEARLRFAQNFVDIVRAAVPGEELAVTVIRGDETLELRLEIAAASPDLQVAVDAEELLGLQLEKTGLQIAGLHPNAEIRKWGPEVERLAGARITQIIGRKIKDRAELGEVLADLRQLVAFGRVGTVAIGFALPEGEILVQDFPIARP
ncbi:MAG: trypsin-like peptidase domain-containing protein [Nannocystaceae bacterium]